MQTGWFTVWAKGKKNLGLVSLVPESRLHLHLHLSRSHGDRWGATDIATLSLHLIGILFSDFLRASQNFNPVHSEMLFSHRFFCQLLLLRFCSVPCVYHLNKSDPITEKRPRRPKSRIRDGFEEMEYEFPFVMEHSVRKNRNTYLNVPLLPEIFCRPERLKKSWST